MWESGGPSKSRAFPFFLPFRLLAVSTALDGIGSDSTQLVRVAPCLLVFFFGFDMEQHVFFFYFFVPTVSLRAHQEDAGDSSGFFFFFLFQHPKEISAIRSERDHNYKCRLVIVRPVGGGTSKTIPVSQAVS